MGTRSNSRALLRQARQQKRKEHLSDVVKGIVTDLGNIPLHKAEQDNYIAYGRFIQLIPKAPQQMISLDHGRISQLYGRFMAKLAARRKNKEARKARRR